jgi:hypothetical protein
MTDILLPVNKVLVKEYYQLNTGFFLLVITIAFGFMSGIEHRALAEFFISSPATVSIPVFAWGVYLIKIINFNRNQALLPQNQFLYSLSLLPHTQQLVCFFISLTNQFMPAILYGTFLVIMALKNNFIFAALAVPAALLLLLALGTFTLLRQFNLPVAESKIGFFKRFFDYRITKPLIQFYLEWIVRREAAVVLGTKLFCALLIFGTTQLYEGEDYDVRLMAMACTLAFSANFTIIGRLHYFENKVFALLRNLPFAILKRTAVFLTVLIILCLPEISILIKYFPAVLSWTQAPLLILYGAGIGVLFYGFHFTGVIHHENFQRLIFALFIGWILLILFKVPIVAMALVNAIGGVWLVRCYFYRFEWHDVEDSR